MSSSSDTPITLEATSAPTTAPPPQKKTKTKTTVTATAKPKRKHRKTKPKQIKPKPTTSQAETPKRKYVHHRKKRPYVHHRKQVDNPYGVDSRINAFADQPTSNETKIAFQNPSNLNTVQQAEQESKLRNLELQLQNERLLRQQQEQMYMLQQSSQALQQQQATNTQQPQPQQQNPPDEKKKDEFPKEKPRKYRYIFILVLCVLVVILIVSVIGRNAEGDDNADGGAGGGGAGITSTPLKAASIVISLFLAFITLGDINLGRASRLGYMKSIGFEAPSAMFLLFGVQGDGYEGQHWRDMAEETGFDGREERRYGRPPGVY